MTKSKMLCPFSKSLCRECAVFRGRHYYLCYGRSRAPEDMDLWQEASGFKIDTGSRMKEIPEPPVLVPSPKWLCDVEDCIEGR
jgi:hypothetical protein